MYSLGNSLKFLFFPSEMGNFRLFQQARCEVIVKYTNCNLLEHEWIRTGIRTLEAQIDEKKVRTLKLGKMLLVLFLKKVVHLCCWMDRRSCSQVFFKIGVLQNLAIFIKQHFINPTKRFSFLLYRNRYGWVKAMYKDTLA